MNKELFVRQFILTKQEYTPIQGWNKITVGGYMLYTHPKLEVTVINNGITDLVLLGYLFDWEYPEFSNEKILLQLINLDFTNYLNKLNTFSGQFIVLRSVKNDHLTLISDAGGQREVYYSTNFCTLASQPKLLVQAMPQIPHEDEELRNFFNSEKFKKYCYYISDTTQWKNVNHLPPNNYIDLINRKIIRFFPSTPIGKHPLDYVVEKSILMIKGYFKAVTNRYKIALPVTAGYDSRLLFSASLDVDCRYFIFKHRQMTEDHYDVAVPRKLLKICKKDFEVISYNEIPNDNNIKLHNDSIDFARRENTAMIFNGYKQLFDNQIVIDSIMSELARNRYGNIKNINGNDLAYLNHYKRYKCVTTLYNKWLEKNRQIIIENNYNILDLFYWEEIMGNWAAKSKTECMLGTELFSLLNSRNLIILLLSTDIKYRNTNHNILFNRIISKLIPHTVKIPFNPSIRTSLQILMQITKLYDPYRYIKLKIKL